MKEVPKFIFLILLVISCQKSPSQWNGSVLTQPREYLTVEELLEGKTQPLLDMSYYSKPKWGNNAKYLFSGSIMFQETELKYPKEKEHYPGENIFPELELEFISHNEELIPLVRERIMTRHQSKSYWDVIVGTGKLWHEDKDGEWNRASFPLTLTDRWIGTARNCVATFVINRIQ